MNTVLVKYFEDFGYGVLEGLFLCEYSELVKLQDRDIYFGEALGKHSDVVSSDTYDRCEIVSQSFHLIYMLQSVFSDNTISGVNPLEYL